MSCEERIVAAATLLAVGMAVLMLLAFTASGQQIRVTLDTQRPVEPWSIAVFEGATPTIRAVLLNDGGAYTNLTGWGGSLHMFTDPGATTSDYSFASTSVTTNAGFVDFKLSSVTMDPGDYLALFVLTNATTTLVWGGPGVVTVLDNPAL